MKLRFRKFTAPIALLVTVGVIQLYVGAGMAQASLVSAVSPKVTSAPVLGILSTRDNKPITVNGASAVTGATIPTGATIETPDNVSATIKLGVLGNICVAPNTKFVLAFDRAGNIGNVQVALTEGCVILRTLKGAAGNITSAQGTIGQISAKTGGSIDVCLRAGVSTINQGAASDAGAGASALDCGAAGAAAAPGFPLAATIAIIAGGATAIIVILTGRNPSPTTP